MSDPAELEKRLLELWNGPLGCGLELLRDAAAIGAELEREAVLDIVANTMVLGTDDGELSAAYACDSIDRRVRARGAKP